MLKFSPAIKLNTVRGLENTGHFCLRLVYEVVFLCAFSFQDI